MIGRFSALSVADVVNITSFYNGKAYYYVMNKDIDQLHIDLLYEKETDEHNGVEVRVPFNGEIEIDDWESICYIDNVYVANKRSGTYLLNLFLERFNNRKVTKFKNFKILDSDIVTSIKRRPKVLIGNIPYAVDYYLLWNNDISYDDWEQAMDVVVPCIDIGEVDITPNREGLLYSKRTKEALRKAYNNTIEELTQLWDKFCNKEVDDFKEFAFSIKQHAFNILHLEYNEVEMSDKLLYKIRYKDFENYNFNNLRDIIRVLLSYDVNKHAIAHLENGKLRKKCRLFSINKLMQDCVQDDIVLLVVPNHYGFNSKYIEGFLTEQYPDKTVIVLKELSFSFFDIICFIRNNFTRIYSNYDNLKLLIKCVRELLEWFKKYTITKDIINSTEYLKYKKNHKPSKSHTLNNAKVTFHIFYPNYVNSSKYTSTPEKILKYLKDNYSNKRIVYANINNDLIAKFKRINYPNLIIIGLSQNNIRLADNGLFPKWIRPIEELYDKNNRILQKIAALNYIRKKCEMITFSTFISTPIPEIFKCMAIKLIEISKKYDGIYYNNSDVDKILDIVPEELYDIEIIALYHQLEKYIKLIKVIGNNHSGYVWYFLMKAKKLRLDYTFYSNFKNQISEIIQKL